MDYKRHFIFYSAILVFLIITSRLIKNENLSKKYIYNSSSNNYINQLKDVFFKRKNHLKKTCEKYSHILLPEYAIGKKHAPHNRPENL